MTRSGVIRRLVGRHCFLLLLLLSGLVLPAATVLAQSTDVRPPAVAGSFYPADPEALWQRIEDLLAAAPADGIAPTLPVRAGITTSWCSWPPVTRKPSPG